MPATTDGKKAEELGRFQTGRLQTKARDRDKKVRT